MKIDVSPTSKKFEPITLTITLETRDELLDMYARHCAGNHIIAKVFTAGGNTRGVSDDEIIAACLDTPSKPSILVVLRRLAGGK